MAITISKSCGVAGLEAPEVNIEVHVSRGLPTFKIVGIQEVQGRESRERVRSALINQGYKFPPNRYTINLSTQSQNKLIGSYELGMAIGVLLSTAQINIHPRLSLENLYFAADLSLSGDLVPNEYTEIIALNLSRMHSEATLIVPSSESWIADFLPHLKIIFFENLKQVCEYLGSGQIEIAKKTKCPYPKINNSSLCLSEIEGLNEACLALEVAASGGHSMVIGGSSGSGKTMLCRRASGILPPLDREQQLEVYSIYKLAQIEPPTEIPFRLPLHSASIGVLNGSSQQNNVGEFALANHGVVFYDDLQEIPQEMVDAVRLTLSQGFIRNFKPRQKLQYPARFLFLAAYQPCECGKLYENKCRCTKTTLMKYERKYAVLFKDVFDIHIKITRGLEEKSSPNVASDIVRDRVNKAREIQIKRQGRLNANLTEKELVEFAPLNSECSTLISKFRSSRNISQKSLIRIQRLARTVADINARKEITLTDLSKAIYLHG